MSDPAEDLIEKFQECWENHNLSTLNDLFADDYTYIVNGKEKFKEKKSLRHYWGNNRRRQRNLKISFFNIRYGDGELWATFTATFHHIVTSTFNVISGDIHLKFDNNSKIFYLNEHYVRIKIFQLRGPWASISRKIAPAIYPFKFAYYWFLKNAARATNIVFLLMLASVCLIWGVSRFLPQNFDAIFGSGASNFILLEIAPIAFILIWFLQQALTFLRGQRESKILSISPIAGNSDLAVILRETKNADRVRMLSGDYSFIDQHTELEKRFVDLACEGKLELFSYRSQNIVEKEMRAKNQSEQILIKLLDDNAFVFDCSVQKKCTIVETGGLKKLLFRFNANNSTGREQLYMGVLKATPHTIYMIDILSGMFDSFVE